MKVPDGVTIQTRGKKYKSGDECPDDLIPDNLKKNKAKNDFVIESKDKKFDFKKEK